MKEEPENGYGDIVIADLTAIYQCLYCGRERHWYDVLDKNGNCNEGEPLLIPDEHYPCDCELELRITDESGLPEFLEFCSEKHFEKWFDERFVQFVKDELKKHPPWEKETE